MDTALNAPTPRLRPVPHPQMRQGMLLCCLIAAAGFALARLDWAQHLGLSALTCSIILGIAVGNSFFPALAPYTARGVDFSKSVLLRAGIVLFGLHVTLQQIAAVGRTGIVIDALMVTLTFVLALQLGTRVLRLDRETSMLIGAGSAICGAAAVLATEPVVRAEAHKVSVAVASVVIFGTLAMVLYPMLYPYLGLSDRAYGIFAGSTIHEVAQVVVAGRSVSLAAGNAAVIEKMLRVMMLAPFLLILSSRTGDNGSGRKRRIAIPWFAVLFIGASLLNSADWLDAGLRSALLQIDGGLLAMALAALGLRTHIGAIREAGARPLALAAAVAVFLLVGGYGVNLLVTRLL
jgi:uncharacterized integral membrane protein (TIGR00698 family)